MTCGVWNEAFCQRLQEGRATGDDLEALRVHLGTPCASCMETLAELDDAQLVIEIAGAEGQLAEAEKEVLFANVWSEVAPLAMHAVTSGADELEGRRPAVPAPLRPHARGIGIGPRAQRLALAAAVALVAVMGLLTTRRTEDMRLKGLSRSETQLQAYVAEPSPSGPTLGRSIDGGDRVNADEQLVFRYQIAFPSWMYLLTQNDGRAELVYAGDRSMPAGAHELAEAGQALGLRLEYMSGPLDVVLLSAPSALEEAQVRSLPALSDATIRELCAACGVARMRLMVESKRP